MESKDEAAVERQKLVDDGEIENEDDQATLPNSIPPSAPKSVQTPNSPASNKVQLLQVVHFEQFLLILSFAQYLDILKRRNKSHTRFKQLLRWER